MLRLATDTTTVVSTWTTVKQNARYHIGYVPIHDTKLVVIEWYARVSLPMRSIECSRCLSEVLYTYILGFLTNNGMPSTNIFDILVRSALTAHVVVVRWCLVDGAAATVKGETLRLALLSAGRACPEWGSCDTASGEISSGRGGREGSIDEVMPLPSGPCGSVLFHANFYQPPTGRTVSCAWGILLILETNRRRRLKQTGFAGDPIAKAIGLTNKDLRDWTDTIKASYRPRQGSVQSVSARG